VAENVLGTIFGRADALKRQLYDMIRNPSDYASMVGGRTQENMAAAQALQNQAFADPQNPLRITNPQALNQLTQMITSGPLGFAPAGITAFHGSPYLFRQFDPAKIGSGEGAQVYGVGAGYTAEAKPVAESYKRMEAEYRKMTGGMEPDVEYAYDLVAKGMSDSQIIDNFAYKYGSQMDFDKAINAIKTAKQYANEGYLYKGDIPDEILPKFLDWDKPLSEQSKEVKQAAKNVWEQVKGNSAFKGKTFDDFLSESGESLYLRLGAGKEGKQADLSATNFLESVGVKGIRYLDQGSRGEGKGTSNFIPFRAEDYKIQEINDTPIEDYIAKGLL
jgi:hypothetical protein